MSKIIQNTAIVPSSQQKAYIRYLTDIALRSHGVTFSYDTKTLEQNKIQVLYTFTCDTLDLARDMLRQARNGENIYNGIPVIDEFGCDSAKWY